MLGTLVMLVLSVSVASRSELVSASLLIVTMRPVGLLGLGEAWSETGLVTARGRER